MRSRSDVPLRIGAANPSQLDKQDSHRQSIPDRLSFEVVWSAKSPPTHSITFASYSPSFRSRALDKSCLGEPYEKCGPHQTRLLPVARGRGSTPAKPAEISSRDGERTGSLRRNGRSPHATHGGVSCLPLRCRTRCRSRYSSKGCRYRDRSWKYLRCAGKGRELFTPLPQPTLRLRDRIDGQQAHGVPVSRTHLPLAGLS